MSFNVAGSSLDTPQTAPSRLHAPTSHHSKMSADSANATSFAHLLPTSDSEDGDSTRSADDEAARRRRAAEADLVSAAQVLGVMNPAPLPSLADASAQGTLLGPAAAEEGCGVAGPKVGAEGGCNTAGREVGAEEGCGAAGPNVGTGGSLSTSAALGTSLGTGTKEATAGSDTAGVANDAAQARPGGEPRASTGGGASVHGSSAAVASAMARAGGAPEKPESAVPRVASPPQPRGGSTTQAADAASAGRASPPPARGRSTTQGADPASKGYAAGGSADGGDDRASASTTNAATNQPPSDGLSAAAAAAMTPAVSVKAMAPVSDLAVGRTPTADSAASLREAFASVAHQATLRGVASGEIDLPDLGRIAVKARSVEGGVDVEVNADRPDARSTLRSHTDAMVADLQRADLKVTRLSVDPSPGARSDSPAGGQAFGSGGRSLEGQSDPRESRRDPGTDAERASHDDGDESPSGAWAGRVRIVL